MNDKGEVGKPATLLNTLTKWGLDSEIVEKLFGRQIEAKGVVN